MSPIRDLEIKAIETKFDGYRFRSRTEARWAVFFKAAGIEYQYEPEGFVLGDGSCYLPDFYLPDVGGRAGGCGLWVEVKGRMTEDAIRKAELFSKNGDRPLLLVGYIPPEEYWLDDRRSRDGYWSCRYIDGDDYPVAFYRHPSSGKVCIYGWDNVKHADDFNNAAGFRYLDKCFDKARQARFEHGESPLV